ncbi:YbjO family protein [Pantoea sp. 1.19]|uniref:YbjO family protein n=1 Tax=Pantoea sp. 1.19 TaxID=1925589 RepID=UPI000948D439|nr:YbjO family protein [Pantoea sp. 1.19]
MSELFRVSPPVRLTAADVPVPVRIAGMAIIVTRCLSVLMLAADLGYDGLADFVHRSAQAWDSTLIFIASQLLFFIELRCAIRLMRGDNRGRWGYVISQLLVVTYLLLASLGWIYPEIFSLRGDTPAAVIHALCLHKLPDFLVILLLFLPVSSRQFFQAGR